MRILRVIFDFMHNLLAWSTWHEYTVSREETFVNRKTNRKVGRETGREQTQWRRRPSRVTDQQINASFPLAQRVAKILHVVLTLKCDGRTRRRNRALVRAKKATSYVTYKPVKTKFLNADDIDRSIAAVAALSAKEKIRVALLGGAALQLFGSTRLTKDVDVVANASPETVRTTKRLSFGGVRTKIAGTEVDFIVRDDKYKRLYEAALQHAVRVKGVPIPVVSPEWIVPLKMAAGRPKDELDIAWMIAEKGLVDRKKARVIIEKHLGLYAGDDFDSLCLEADWVKNRGGE